MILIAGDIGGTTSRFQWLDTDTPNLISAPIYYQSNRYDSFTFLLETLLHEYPIPPIDSACFALPGPTDDCSVDVTNLPWKVTLCAVSHTLNCRQVSLINDFHATALGLDSLATESLICLWPGQYRADGNRLVVGAGTGLGVAPICHINQHFYPQSSEGGHLSFAPVNDQQQRLLTWTRGDQRRVNYEYYLSGRGLERLYQFCCHDHKKSSKPLNAECLHHRAEGGELAAREARQLFVMIYGQFIGEMALLWPARAGIYIAGGIAAKNPSWLKGKEFTDSLHAKNEMRDLVERMPVYLITDEHVGLTGALICAGIMKKNRLVMEKVGNEKLFENHRVDS